MPDLWKYTRAQSDTDASTFFTACTAAGTTLNASQQSAIYFLVGGLKTLNLWSSMTALYPFIGGSAGAHAINLKTPGTYNITWSVSGVTHNSNGITGNGTTGYGDTGVNPSLVLSQNSVHVSCYSRTQTALDGWVVGNRVAGTWLGIAPKQSDGFCYAAASDTASISSATQTVAGFALVSRISSSIRNVFNQRSPKYAISSTSAGLNNQSTFVLANNASGVGAANFSSKNIPFISIGSGLTDTQALNLNQIVQAYQTLLGRQV